MSDRAREFLDNFIEGLQVTGSQIGSDAEAHAFVQAAMAEALEDGISEGELTSAADGDLDEYLRNALAPEDGD